MRNAAFKSMTLSLLASAALLAFAPSSFALTDGRNTPSSAEEQDTLEQNAFEGTTLPRPGLSLQSNDAAPADDGDDNVTKPDAAASDKPAADAPPAEIIRDLSTLPAPVKAMREKLVEAAASGDIGRLRPLIEGTPKPPQVMNNESDDPIDTLKNFSGDPDGQEILAIMLDLLATGAAHIDKGTPEEAYVWPYFTGKTLSSLTPPERVELLRIVTAGDLMGMEETGNYNFYRIGISPDGQLKFISGGD